jgi:hypothetical protein
LRVIFSENRYTLFRIMRQVFPRDVVKFGLTALLACALSCAAHPATAGMLNYGCKGELNGTSILFDRMNLVMMPKQVADGDIAGLSKGYVLYFEADGSNDALQPVMKFGDGTIVLTQKSSKLISRENGHVGTREKSFETYRRTYHIVKNGDPDKDIDADITMRCMYYLLTAP